jgi:hypothetical protein
MSQQPRLPILLVCLLVALPAQVVLHELGHIAAARLMGDSGATLHLTPRAPAGSLWIGAAHYDGATRSAAGQVAASLGGLLLTQCVALALLVGSVPWPQRARTYAAVAVGAFLLDVPAQVVGALIAEVAQPPRLSGVDLADVMSVVHAWTGASVVGMKTGLLFLLAGYALGWGYALRRRFGGRSWAA